MHTGAGTPLPRGRHGIDREDIRANQRGRILGATIECVADRGYAQTTVGHIVAQAHVSRETFYELFVDKESCYEAAVREAIGDVTTAWERPLDDTSLPVAERLETGLRDYFAALAGNPALATCFILERPAGRRLTMAEDVAGEPAVARVHGLLGTDDTFAVQAYLSLLDGIVRRYVAQARIDELPALVDDLMPVVRRVLSLA